MFDPMTIRYNILKNKNFFFIRKKLSAEEYYWYHKFENIQTKILLWVKNS